MKLNGENESWKKNLKFINRCPLCDKEYKLESVKVVTSQNRTKFIHITCASCKSNFMAMISAGGPGAAAVGMITDCSYEDVKRLQKAPVLTADDVVEGYRFLQDGNFEKELIF